MYSCRLLVLVLLESNLAGVQTQVAMGEGEDAVVAVATTRTGRPMAKVVP